MAYLGELIRREVSLHLVTIDAVEPPILRVVTFVTVPAAAAVSAAPATSTPAATAAATATSTPSSFHLRNTASPLTLPTFWPGGVHDGDLRRHVADGAKPVAEEVVPHMSLGNYNLLSGVLDAIQHARDHRRLGGHVRMLLNHRVGTLKLGDIVKIRKGILIFPK